MAKIGKTAGETVEGIVDRAQSRKTQATVGGFALLTLIATGAIETTELVTLGAIGLAGGGLFSIAMEDWIKAWRTNYKSEE